MNTISLLTILLALSAIYCKCNDIVIHRFPDPVIVSWSGLNVSGVWEYNVSVQVKNMPYDKGFVGVGWNDKPYMDNATMMILSNNEWDVNWSFGKYIAKDHSPPDLIEKQNFTIEIVNGSLTFTFITLDNINDMYVIYAYSNRWGLHGNQRGVSYTPVSDYVNNITNTSNGKIKKSLKSKGIKSPKSPGVKKSPNIYVPIKPVNKAVKHKNSSIHQKNNILYVCYIVFTIVIIM
jgi:hypothetical protein